MTIWRVAFQFEPESKQFVRVGTRQMRALDGNGNLEFD